MKIIFFGLGSIGLRHAKMLKQAGGHQVYAFRSKRLKGNNLGIAEIYDWKSVSRINPDIAFITNPTGLHIKTAIKCACRSMALFVEKPLGSNLSGLDELIQSVKKQKLVTYVAYALRFHPVIRALKKLVDSEKPLHARVLCTSHLSQWRIAQRGHISYSRLQKMGGGVILDLSHELDYVNFLFGKIRSMSGRFGKRGRVTVDAEDFADILLDCKKAPVNLHLNFLSHEKRRQIQIDFSHQTVVADLIGSSLAFYKNEKRTKRIQFKTGIPECYSEQMKYFMKNLHNSRMMNHISEASELFKIICQFKTKRKYAA